MLNSGKLENKESRLRTTKSGLQEEKRTLSGTNHTVLSDVSVCACVLSVWILVLSGSLRVYKRKGGLGQWSSMTKVRRTEIGWPLLSVPPTYLSMKGMLPGAFLLNCDGNQCALSSTLNCKKRACKYLKDRRDVWIAIFEWYGRMAGHAENNNTALCRRQSK